MSERYIHLLKLGMGRNPQVDVTVPFSVLIEACKFFYEKGEAIAYIVGTSVKAGDAVDESNAIYLSDLKETNDYLSLLMVRGDPSRGVPGFVNTKTRKVTTIQSSEPGAVRGVSCHLVISKQEIAAGTNQGRHRMAMEQATGIGRVLARDFIGKLLAQYAEQHPDKFKAEKKRTKKGEKPETLSYRPTVRFHPQENASLKDDLLDGRIGGFRLVRGNVNFQGEADEPAIERLDVKLHARIVPTKNFGKVRALADHLQQYLESVSFEDLKIELVDEDGDVIPVPRAISLDAEAQEDMRYCKKLLITGLTESPAECYPEFYKPFVAFAESAIANEENWK